MTKAVSLFLFTLLALSIAAYGYSGKQYGKGQWWNNTKVLEQLKLTDQQKATINGIASSNKQGLENLYAQFRTEREELHQFINNPNSTKDQILAKFDQFEKTRGELKQNEFKMSLAMRDVLSPDQKKMLSDIKGQHEKGRGSDKCDE